MIIIHSNNTDKQIWIFFRFCNLWYTMLLNICELNTDFFKLQIFKFENVLCFYCSSYSIAIETKKFCGLSQVKWYTLEKFVFQMILESAIMFCF